MQQSYFISDIHLGDQISPSENKRTERLIKFLESISDTAAYVFFIGDLFDFWFEYKYVIPKRYFAVLYELKKLVLQNIEIHYLAGNHDFWLGDFFKDELGVHTHDNDWQGEIYGKKFYLYHGDGIAKRDRGYRILKRILRNRTNIKLYRLLHPDLGIPLARLVSGSSRHYTKTINLQGENDYIEYAQSKFDQGFDYVLMGHRHKPAEYLQGHKKYINLGDWMKYFSYAVFDGKSLDLNYFKE